MPHPVESFVKLVTDYLTCVVVSFSPEFSGFFRHAFAFALTAKPAYSDLATAILALAIAPFIVWTVKESLNVSVAASWWQVWVAG